MAAYRASSLPQHLCVQVAEAAAKPAGGGLLSSFVRSLGVSVVGTASLTRDDIEPALEALKRKLMERNVAAEIADKCAYGLISLHADVMSLAPTYSRIRDALTAHPP